MTRTLNAESRLMVGCCKPRLGGCCCSGCSCAACCPGSLKVETESSEAASIALQMAGNGMTATAVGSSSSPRASIEDELKLLHKKARKSFKVLPFQKLSQRRFTERTTFEPTDTISCDLGDCDVFVSHSWSDPGLQRWTTLRDWAQAFQRYEKRAPLLWIDSARAHGLEASPTAQAPRS